MIKKLTEYYNSAGRAGNIILLLLLILSALFNRLYMSAFHGSPEYIAELFIIVIAVLLVKKIFNSGGLVLDCRKIYRNLLIAGIVLRIILAVHDIYNRPVQDSDYEKHEKLGMRMATEGEFYDFAGVELRNFRQPGLPAVFAAGLLIYNHPVTFAAVMIFFSFGVLISGYFLFRNLKNVSALISFAYLCISPNMIFMASNSNTQLSFFFCIILLFILLKNYSGKTYQLIMIGLILAAEMYIRFNFLLILILIPFLIEKHQDRKISFALGKAGLIYLCFLIFYFPWVYRNYNIYGTLRLMPTSGLGLYSSNVTSDPRRLGDYNGVPDSVMKKYSNLTEMEFDEALKQETFNYVKNHPGIYFKGLPYKMIKYSGWQDWTISYFFQYTKYPNARLIEGFFQTIENFFFWIILLYPLVFLMRNKKLSPLSQYILFAYLIYSLILFPISETRARYNFPYILFPMFAVSFADRKNDDEISSKVKL